MVSLAAQGTFEDGLQKNRGGRSLPFKVVFSLVTVLRVQAGYHVWLFSIERTELTYRRRYYYLVR